MCSICCLFPVVVAAHLSFLYCVSYHLVPFCHSLQKPMQTSVNEGGLLWDVTGLQLALSEGGEPLRHVLEEALRLAALKPTFTPADDSTLGCKHMSKRFLVRAPCCRDFFACTSCHNENKQPGHPDFGEITEIVCMLCLQRGRSANPQPFASVCRDCNNVLAAHICNICKIMQDRPISHCELCDECFWVDEDHMAQCPHNPVNIALAAAETIDTRQVWTCTVCSLCHVTPMVGFR